MIFSFPPSSKSKKRKSLLYEREKSFDLQKKHCQCSKADIVIAVWSQN